MQSCYTQFLAKDVRVQYWLDLFTPYTWDRFRLHGSRISGFRPRQRRAAFERVKQGDLLICYLVRLSRWCGLLEVLGGAFEDESPIFAESNDPFPIRFDVKPQVQLDFPFAIPIDRADLWSQLSFTRDIVAGSVGWAQQARLRQSLISISAEDGKVISDALRQQAAEEKTYELDTIDRKHISQRTVVRTEQGEVEVEVPGPELSPEHVEVAEPRASTRVQAQIAQLGAILGFKIWIPPGDRSRLMEALPKSFNDQLSGTLPLNYDLATLKTIENIDVLWLDRRSIAHAFEVEHTTSIYSGLLRMADLLAMQPRMSISLHIVAPPERRAQVRREIVRPVFSVLEGGSMATRCSYLSYDAIDTILAQPNLSHMRESILADYEEFFDDV